jgi:hypothetical protein
MHKSATVDALVEHQRQGSGITCRDETLEKLFINVDFVRLTGVVREDLERQRLELSWDLCDIFKPEVLCLGQSASTQSSNLRL